MTTQVRQSMKSKLAEAREISESCVCVGLDPDPRLMPIDDVFEFNRAIVDATHDLVAAYKPQFAFYEALGIEGLKALERTVSYIRDVAPDVFLVADAKRGDIGNVAGKYAASIFGNYRFDACTVYAYQGSDALQPFLEYEGRGVFVVCRTSNPSSIQLQDVVDVESGKRVFEIVARQVEEISDGGNVGWWWVLPSRESWWSCGAISQICRF